MCRQLHGTSATARRPPSARHKQQRREPVGRPSSTSPQDMPPPHFHSSGRVQCVGAAGRCNVGQGGWSGDAWHGTKFLVQKYARFKKEQCAPLRSSRSSAFPLHADPLPAVTGGARQEVRSGRLRWPRPAELQPPLACAFAVAGTRAVFCCTASASIAFDFGSVDTVAADLPA